MVQSTCGNSELVVDDITRPCSKQAQSVCGSCFLLEYCCKDCQVQHWPVHKLDCKSPLSRSDWKPAWFTEKRRPAFMTAGIMEEAPTAFGLNKYLWGNIPAIDLLRNRVGGDNDLHLLFAASGDMRNVVKTLAGLPESFPGKCEVVINDKDFDIVARNVILLLVALSFSPAKAVPIMIHIWYSALIPKALYDDLRASVLPLFVDVCAKIKAKPEEILQAKTWTFGSRSLRLILPKKDWDRLPQYLTNPEELSITKAHDIRVAITLAPQRIDYLHRALYDQPPRWRICHKRFRQDGILAPFGVSRKQFDTPNPTIFQDAKTWPMYDSAQPLEGWNIPDVLKKASRAKHDIYGTLTYYLKDLLLQFCKTVQSVQTSFEVLHVNASELPDFRGKDGRWIHYFDRIETTNIADRGYLGPRRTIELLGPLLKRRSQDPTATLTTLFLNAVWETAPPGSDRHEYAASLRKAAKFLSLVPTANDIHPDTMRVMNAAPCCANNEKSFKRFMDEAGFRTISRETGMNVRANNTIVEKWPTQLKPNATKYDFDLLQAAGVSGYERYVEWESAD